MSRECRSVRGADDDLVAPSKAEPNGETGFLSDRDNFVAAQTPQPRRPEITEAAPYPRAVPTAHPAMVELVRTQLRRGSDRSVTLISHARVCTALSTPALPFSMTLAPAGALLVAAVGCAPLRTANDL